MQQNYKIGVVGLWHLGQTYCVGLAELGHEIIGFDKDFDAVRRLENSLPTIVEPGVEELLRKHVGVKLSFTSDPEPLKDCDVVWITYDTPVDEKDVPDTSVIFSSLQELVPMIKDGVLIIISSQIPVGTTQSIKSLIKNLRPFLTHDIAYVPENLFLGNALKSFFEPRRIVIGAEDVGVFEKIESIFAGIKTDFLRMSIASAEMSKHALNAFGATSLSFIHDIADVCEAVGADIMDVLRALKSEPRVGPNAYISPGLGFSGGTLGRDLNALLQTGGEYGVLLPVIKAVYEKNTARRRSVPIKLLKVLGTIDGRTIGVLGLTYKPGTPTLRRSLALEIIKDLKKMGCRIRAHDPMADPQEVLKHNVDFFADPYEAASGCHALIFVTDWPEFSALDFEKIRPLMKKPAVLFDTKNLFYEKSEKLKNLGFSYLGIGRPRSEDSTAGIVSYQKPADSDKVMIITGGSGGIGFKIAEKFLQEGCFVVLVSRNKEPLEKALAELSTISNKVNIIPADVSRPEDVKQIEKFIVTNLGGRVDMLVNAAGILGPIGSLDKMGEDEIADWLQTLEINIFGTALMSKMVIPFMKQRGQGRIINFSGGGDGPLPNFTAYVASKGAILRFTESLAAELENFKIWVNAIAPGAVVTRLTDQVLAAGPEKAGKEFYEKSLKWKEEGGTPSEKTAQLILFLASSASDGITGKFFSATWDNFDAIAKYKEELMKSDIYTVRRIKPEDRGYHF